MSEYTLEELKAEKARRESLKAEKEKARKDALIEQVSTPPSRETERLSLGEDNSLQVEQLDTEDDGRKEAATAGLFEGVTAGHSAEISAGIETITDIASGEMTVGSFGESYIAKRNEYEKILDDMESKFPAEYNFFNIAGHAATTPLSIPGSAAMALASGHGYAQPKKRSELMTLDERANALAVGGAYEVGGRIIPAASARLIDKGRNAAGSMYHKYMAGTLAEALGVVGKYKQRLMTNLRRSGREIEDWADNLLTIKDGQGRNLIEKGQTYSETYDKVISFKKELGEEVGSIVDMASESSKPIKGDKVYSKIMNGQLNRKLQSNHAPTSKAAAKYRDELKETFFTPKEKVITEVGPDGATLTKKEMVLEPKDLSLNDLQEIKTSISSNLRDSEGKKIIFSASDDIKHAKMEHKTVGALTSIIEEGVLKSPLSQNNPTVYSTWKKIKQDYGDLAEAETAIEKTIDKLDSPGILSALKDSLNYRGMVVAGMARVAGVPEKAAVSIGVSMNKLISHPATPANMTIQLKNISEAFIANPDKYNNIALKLGAAGAKNNLILGETLAEAGSIVNLAQNPIPRSTEAALLAKDDLLTVLHGKEMIDEAAALRKALNENSGADVLLHELSKNPSLADIFQPGVGWDGKAMSEEEKAEIEMQVKSKYGLKMQNEILTKFRQDSQLPDLNMEDEMQEAMIIEKAKDKVRNKPY